MYGTIDDKSVVGRQSAESTGSIAKSAEVATPISSQRWSPPGNGANGDQVIDKSKRIYSHCHVQANETNNHQASDVDKSARRRLVFVSIICLLFMIGEVVGGVLSNSLAIATDAAHLLTDFASFMISLFAIWLSSRPASRKMSFGWYRAEVIGALVSVLMIWLVTGLLVYMAIERLRTQEFEINSLVMVITASAGLLVNILMAIALNVDGHSHGFHSHSHGHGHHHHNHQEDSCEHDHLESGLANRSDAISSILNKSNGVSLENGSQLATSRTELTASLDDGNHKKNNTRGRGKKNINVRAAFIHVIGDFLQSLGVLIAALVIHFEPSYAIVDPICTFLFSIIVLITTINIIRDAVNVLMEGIPDGVNFIEVRETLQELPSVIRVHNLRIWSLSLDKIAISTHLVIDNSKKPSQILQLAIDTLKSKYNFFEVTIQVEEYRDEMKECEHCQDEEVTINVLE